MNIKNISIKHFRNFDDISIDFSGGFQTIIGENNIGKSNLYWAIRLVLDCNLTINSRILELKDFNGFKRELTIDDHIIISIELFSNFLSSFPTFHSMKTSNSTARITYVFAHASKFVEKTELPATVDISQFKWQLFASGNSMDLTDILKLNTVSFRDLDGINVYYINAFRNTNTELHGNTKSLLTKYCQSRKESKTELESVKNILNKSSNDLNSLKFIPEVAESLRTKGQSIAGKYFSFPISVSFLSNFDIDAWSQLNLYYSPENETNLPIYALGLGQKNILYLSLFIAELENTCNKHEINILLIEEPEAHLHPQLQKILFSNLSDLKNTQVFMTSHSTHIASDCDYKNLNILYKNNFKKVNSFSPFKAGILSPREESLLKRYLDATRSELFFASAIIFVEGVGEQFIIPTIAKQVYNINLTEHNISVIPIHSRYFDPFLKLVQNNNLEIPAVALIDGDISELEDGELATTSVENAMKLQVTNRVFVSVGSHTLEVDLFPNSTTNNSYLKTCFKNLGHENSFNNLIKITKDNPALWPEELIKRIDKTVKKGRFAQELSILIDTDFIVPTYINLAITHIAKLKTLVMKNA
jgi:putative ATP-dependent endonuclease of OLD family